MLSDRPQVDRVAKAGPVAVIERCLANSSGAMRLLIHARNFLNRVINQYLEDAYDMDSNGEEVVAAALGPRVRTFVDVGSNLGQWATMFTRYCPEPIAGYLFEPSPWALETLRKKFADHKNVEIVPMAVSDTTGNAEFFELPDSGKSSLIEAWPAADSQRREVQKRQVQKTTLDEQSRERGWQEIGFLKIDVEGAELSVLKGARDLLERNAVGYIQFEFNHPWRLAGATLGQAIDYLGGFGYEVYLLRPRGLFRFSYQRFGEFSALANFLAVARGRKQEILPIIKGTA